MASFKTIQNGEPATPTFSAGEMARRLGGLRRHMAAADLDAVLLTSIHGINYFSDFLYCSFGRSYGLVVTADAATTISANLDGGQPYRRGVGENLVYTDWQRDNFIRAVRELTPGARRLGIEADHLTLQAHRKLADALPDTEFIDVADAAMALRMIKSEEEIALIREGCIIASNFNITISVWFNCYTLRHLINC